MARRKPRVAIACVAALLALFSLDALLFRTNLYPSVIDPNSSAGVFELTLLRERRRQAGPGNLIVTLGDSRFAYLPRLANESTASTQYTFTSAGVAGSNPRMWYYMLRDLDPTARRYEAVVFGVDDFDDEERERLHRALDAAIESVQAGRTVDGNEVIRRLLSRP